MAMPTGRMSGLVSRPSVTVASMTAAIEGRGCFTPRIVVRVGSWQTTKASGCAPCSSPSVTPAKEGWKSEPWPSTICQWSLRGGRREPFDRAGDEIGGDRVDRHAALGDQHAGLAGRAELGVVAAPRHLLFERQRRVFLADRAVGADGQEPLAGPLRALSGGEMAVGVAHLVELRALCLRRRANRRDVRQPVVQAARDVHPGVDRLDDRTRSSSPAERRRH